MILWCYEVNCILLDHLVHLLVVLVGAVVNVVWRKADDHFVGEDAQCPPVNGVGVATSLQHFWRNILRGATERVGLLVQLELLGDAEICHLQVAIFSNHNIFRLQVSVDDLVLVQVTEGESHLSCIELGLMLFEVSSVGEVREELAAPDEVEHKEYLVISLEDVLKADKEWMVQLLEDLLFQMC